MVLMKSTHPLEITLARDQSFSSSSILVNDDINDVVELVYENSNGFSCKSVPVTIYIKAEDEEHDSTQLTIQDPIFELCGATLEDTSLHLISYANKSKVDVAGDLRHDIHGGSHVHNKIWQYTFSVLKTNNKKANYQLSIKVTEGNEGQDTSTTPFSAMRLLSLNFPANHTNIPIQNVNIPIIKTFNITNPSELYLEIPQEIETTIKDVTISDILGINSNAYGSCQNCLNDYAIEVKCNKEFYPYFFSKDCDKFMFNYKRVEESSYVRLSDFDSNFITTDIGINTLTYRVVCKETGESLKYSNESVIIETIVLQFNPIIHIKETNVTIPNGESAYDSRSNLVPRKGDILEHYYTTTNNNNEDVSRIKTNEKYNQNLSVFVWEQGAKPGDTPAEIDFVKSLNPLNLKKYAQENNLINITVSPYNLVLDANNDCYNLVACDNEYTINYNEYKNNTYIDNDNNAYTSTSNNCIDAPVYKLQLTLNTDIIVTHLWDSSNCEYVPIEQGLSGTELRNNYNTDSSSVEYTNLFDSEKTSGVFNVDTRLLDNHSFNVDERYVLFRQNRSSKNIRLKYNNIYDDNNSLTINDLNSKEETKIIEVLYQSGVLDNTLITNNSSFITSMELLQSLTKYPEGSLQRTLTTINLNTSTLTRPTLNIEHAYPHEFLVKLSIKEKMESICVLDGCPTIANGVYGSRSEEEMFRIEIGYLDTNVNPRLIFNRAHSLDAVESDEITKIDIVRNPDDTTKNYIDPMTIQNLFYKGNKNTHINKRLIGVRYSDYVMGEYLHNDDFFQNSVYVDYVGMITGKVNKYDPAGNVIVPASVNSPPTYLKFNNGSFHNPSPADDDVNNNNRILLKDYLLTMDKFPNQCIPNDLLGFFVDLHFESLSIDGHSANSGNKGIQQVFEFYHVNQCYRLHNDQSSITQNPYMLPVTIEFKVDQLQFTEHKEELLTKALRHNPNYRNTGVGGDGVVDDINPFLAFDSSNPDSASSTGTSSASSTGTSSASSTGTSSASSTGTSSASSTGTSSTGISSVSPSPGSSASTTGTSSASSNPDYTQIDTLYVSPRVPEGDGYSTNTWIDSVVQHDNGRGKALYQDVLAQSFITNYGNEFVIHETTKDYIGTNTRQNMEDNQEYEFDNTTCFQLTNNDNTKIIFDLERSAQDVLFRHELGDTTDPLRYKHVRNATLEMQHYIKYVDYQGFSHPRYPPAKDDEVVEDNNTNQVIQISGVLNPSCDEEERYALHKTFKWNLQLDIINNPTLNMDSIQSTLMNDDNAELCRPFWMRGQEFAQWLKHAYERKVEQDVLEVEVEPTNVELHENENGATAQSGGANGDNHALDDPNHPLKHMYIDNRGEFHHQFGEKVWIESAEYTQNQPGSGNDTVTLNGIGNNTVGMVARREIEANVSLCAQEAPEFSGLEQCVNVTNNETLLNGLRENNLVLEALFDDLKVKYWDADKYWIGNFYEKGEIGQSNDFHDPNDVEGDLPGLVNDTNNDGPVDFDELTKNPREEVYTTDETFSIDNDSVNFKIVYKNIDTDTNYETTTGNRYTINTLLNNLTNEQISVIEIPLIKQDNPESGYVSKTTRVVLKVSVQDTIEPVVTLKDNGVYNVNRLIQEGTNVKWLSSQIEVRHDRYVFEFAHLVKEGYVWDKFENNNCIAIRDMLAPKVLAYEASSEQLASSVLTRSNPNSLQLTSGLTGVVPNNDCYEETHVTSLEYVSTRKDSVNVDEPDNVDSDLTHDSIFNGDVFEGTLTISSYHGEKLNLQYEQLQHTYVSVVTNDTHNSYIINGNGVVGEDSGELVMLHQGEELWNKMGLVQQDRLVVAIYQKQLAHRFTGVNVFERDVDLSYPTCGTLKVTARVVLPSDMLEQCPVTTLTNTSLEFKSVFNGLLLDINNACGLINRDVYTELPLSYMKKVEYEHVTLDCIGTLVDGEIDPVIFARASGSLACSLEFNVLQSTGALFERYTEYDEDINTRETRTELENKLYISTHDNGNPTGDSSSISDKVYSITTDQQNNLKLGGSSSAEMITLKVHAVDAELYCQPLCVSIFTGVLDNQLCDNQQPSQHNITLTEKSIPTLLFIDNVAATKSNIELTGTPVNTHFTDASWSDSLVANWDIPEQLKKDANNNANLRVLIREITVDGVNHYDGDIKGVHLIYNDCQEISHVIQSSNNLTQESDLVDLVNNELEAGHALSLQINAYSGEEIKVTYQAIGFLGKYLVNSDIKTINYTIE